MYYYFVKLNQKKVVSVNKAIARNKKNTHSLFWTSLNIVTMIDKNSSAAFTVCPSFDQVFVPACCPVDSFETLRSMAFGLFF